MDRRDYITVFRRKGMVGGSHMGGLRSGSSLHSKLFSTTLRRRQTITPIKAEENWGKGVEERGIGGDTESRGVGRVSLSI